MRIGILSLVLHTNYGGILQSYALQTVLERMGHEVVILNKDKDIHIGLYKLFTRTIKYPISKYILRRKQRFFNPWKLNSERREREKYTNRFIERYLHTRLITDLRQGVFDDVDAVIVGSDQVWRPLYFGDQWRVSIKNAFLDFINSTSIKRIAYAASFGTDKWEYNEEESKECSRLLTLFDAVSVREKNAIGLCQKYLGRRDVQHVLDPTLLLKKEDYMSLVSQAKTECSPGNLMCYVLDLTDDKKSLVDKIANERGLNAFYTNSKVEDDNAPQNERIQPPVEQWLRGFMDAKFVVTDSFHACVFSIIFGKPFVVIGNKERGMARFMSLLEMFSLHNNLICDINDYNPAYSYGINTSVDEMLDNNRQLSIQFLKNALV